MAAVFPFSVGLKYPKSDSLKDGFKAMIRPLIRMDDIRNNI